MKHAFLVGANHSHQLPGNANGHSGEFAQYLEEHAKRLGIDLIAEEMSREAMELWRVGYTVVERVAECLGLPHLLCDPNSAERRMLGIPSREELQQARAIRIVGQAESLLLDSDERKYWGIREREWHRRASAISHEKVLFVLGPDHVDSFSKVLCESGYSTQVLAARWEA